MTSTDSLSPQTAVATEPMQTFQVSVLPSGRHFSVNPDEAMLAAGIRQGIGLPYGCKDGACGSCKCKKISGVVVHRAHQSKALSAEEEASGFVLTCCGVPHSDVVLESRQVTEVGALPGALVIGQEHGAEHEGHEKRRGDGHFHFGRTQQRTEICQRHCRRFFRHTGKRPLQKSGARERRDSGPRLRARGRGRARRVAPGKSEPCCDKRAPAPDRRAGTSRPRPKAPARPCPDPG